MCFHPEEISVFHVRLCVCCCSCEGDDSCFALLKSSVNCIWSLMNRFFFFFFHRGYFRRRVLRARVVPALRSSCLCCGRESDVTGGVWCLTKNRAARSQTAHRKKQKSLLLSPESTSPFPDGWKKTTESKSAESAGPNGSKWIKRGHLLYNSENIECHRRTTGMRNCFCCSCRVAWMGCVALCVLQNKRSCRASYSGYKLPEEKVSWKNI